MPVFLPNGSAQLFSRVHECDTRTDHATVTNVAVAGTVVAFSDAALILLQYFKQAYKQRYRICWPMSTQPTCDCNEA